MKRSTTRRLPRQWSLLLLVIAGAPPVVSPSSFATTAVVRDVEMEQSTSIKMTHPGKIIQEAPLTASNDSPRSLEQHEGSLRFSRAAVKAVTLELFNTLTNKKVRDLVNGIVISFNDISGMSFNIRAVSSNAGRHSIWFGHNTDSAYRKETKAPYFLCGKDATAVGAVAKTFDVLGYGSHTVTATQYFRFLGRLCKGKTTTVRFVIQSGAAPSTITRPVAGIAPVGNVPTMPSALSQAPVAAISTRKPTRRPTARPNVDVAPQPVNGPVAGIAPVGSSPAIPITPRPVPSAAIPTRKPTRRPTAKPTRSPTIAPTPCPSLEPYINSITQSKRTLSLGGTSPEDRALQWLVRNDTLKLEPCPARNRFRIRQRFALLSLWFQQTEQKKWLNATSWTMVADECQWFGVTCGLRPVHDSSVPQMAVTKVDMLNNNVVGTVPPDLGLLSSLTTLALSDNELTGSLPEAIAQWTILETLHLTNNKVNGTIPSGVGNWRNITDIQLSNNRLSGTLPASIDQWAKLKMLALSFNKIRGSLSDSIGQWRNATDLYLNGNRFSGPLPPSIGQLTKLRTLILSVNSLSGALPETADFEYNNFTGSIANQLCLAPALSQISVDCRKVSCGCCGCAR